MKNKIHKLIHKIKSSIEIGKNFGFLFGIRDFINNVILRSRGNIGKKFNKYYYDSIKEYLKLKYITFIKKYEKVDYDFSNNCIREDSYIWIFWWQGLDASPEVVKECFRSVRRYNKNHKIVVISKDNLNDYLDIPDYILHKVENNIITLTHFSDIIRALLLYRYGGIWIDSTVYLTDEFDKDIYQKNLYTIHHEKRSDYHVCKGKWTGFCMASSKKNPFFEYLSNMFLEYWKQENCLIGYLLIDCFIAIGYENIDWIKKMIDDVPINNTETFEIADNYNKEYTDDLIKNICKNTYIHKLSYKLKIENNENNLYHYIIKNEKVN